MPRMNPDIPEPAVTIPDTVALATVVEARLHDSLNSFALPGARLYGVTLTDIAAIDTDPSSAFRLCFLAQHPDVYDLLDSPTSALGRMFDAAAVVTTGWAAPLGADGQPEGAPSEHAHRRRVRLIVVVSDAGVASVVRFADEPTEIVTDAGSATGSLADAINGFWENGSTSNAAQSQ